MARWKDKETAIRSLENNGRVDPNELIEAARSSDHPCHSDFTWDVAQAAGERWRDQARELIRQCKFEVLVEDVTVSVVRYIPSPDADDPVFLSLPKIRGKAKTVAALLAEINMLLGLASRIRGIALAKSGIVSGEVAAQLGVICDQIEGLKSELEE